MSSNFRGSIIILIGFILTLQATDAVESDKEIFDTIKKAIDLYDSLELWTQIDETIATLDRYRADFSIESGGLIEEIKTRTLNGRDAYFRCTKSISEWCNLTIRELSKYISESESADRKKILITVLDDGINKMNEAQDALGESSTNFNEATATLTSLNARLNNEFDKESSYFQNILAQIRSIAYGAGGPKSIFGVVITAGVVEGKLVPELQKNMERARMFYEEMTITVNKQGTLIEEINGKLHDEMEVIGSLKERIDDISELGDIESVNELIVKCRKYATKHT